MRFVLQTTCAMIALVGVANSQQTPSSMSDQDYIKLVMTAAPPQIVEKATIVRAQEGAMQQLKEGTNGWTCMAPAGSDPMCMDPNAMEWGHAWQTHAPPPDKTGFVYMLAGDTGGSNTDPYAEGKQTPSNHWVRTGPHVMIVGAAAKAMVGYQKTPDPDPTKPYVMCAGTPYEHLMIPVK